MTGVWLLLAVSTAGAVGAVARVATESVLTPLFPRWPAAVLGINVVGSFLLGLLAGAVMFHGAPTTLLVVLGTGFCGGFTTFSTASVQTVRLVQENRLPAAALHLVTTVGLSVTACAVGVALM